MSKTTTEADSIAAAHQYQTDVEKYIRTLQDDALEMRNTTLQDALNKLFLLSSGSLVAMLAYFSSSPENITSTSSVAALCFGVSLILFGTHRALDYAYTNEYAQKCTNILKELYNKKSDNDLKVYNGTLKAIDSTTETNQFYSNSLSNIKEAIKIIEGKYNRVLECLGYGSFGVWVLGIIIAGTHIFTIEEHYEFMGKASNDFIIFKKGHEYIGCVVTGQKNEGNCIKIPFNLIKT